MFRLPILVLIRGGGDILDSTISHLGFILLALTISSVESTQAFIFYLMQYSISNLNAFIILVTIGFSYVRRLASIGIVPKGIRVIDTLCKSTSSPKAEMAEGPEHASKVGFGYSSELTYSNLRDRSSHGDVCGSSRTQIHPGRDVITTDFEFETSGKSVLKSISKRQYLTKVIELSPKRRETITMRRNTGSPKGGNPYW